MTPTCTRRQVLGLMAMSALAWGVTDSATTLAQAPPSDFLRMLSLVPNTPEVWHGFLTYANLAPLKSLYNATNVHTTTDLFTPDAKAYTTALNGCMLSAFTGQGHIADGEQRDAFGYDIANLDREIATGQTPGYSSHMEGTFDTALITDKLSALGYQPVTYADGQYASVRGDNQFSLPGLDIIFANGSMNRIAVDPGRLIAAGATAAIQAALDAEGGRIPTLADQPQYHALATAIGDVTSLAMLPPEYLAFTAANFTQAAMNRDASALTPQDAAQAIADYTRGWGILPPSTLAAICYTDQGPDARTMHIALVYANPDDAAAAAPEVVTRLKAYRSARTKMPIVPTNLTDVMGRTVMTETMAVAVVDAPVVSNQAGFWQTLWRTRDLLFLTPGPPPMP